MADLARSPSFVAPMIACFAVSLTVCVARHTWVDPSTAAAAYSGRHALTPERIASLEWPYSRRTLGLDLALWIPYMALLWAGFATCLRSALARLDRRASLPAVLAVLLQATWPEHVLFAALILVPMALYPHPLSVAQMRDIQQLRYVLPGTLLPALALIAYPFGSMIWAERDLRIGLEEVFRLSPTEARKARGMGCLPMIFLVAILMVGYFYARRWLVQS